MIVRWSIATGFVGAKYAGEFEVDDDTSEDEIEQLVVQERDNRIAINWDVVRADGTGKRGV